ncbi:hypothetical protein D3C73_1326380 [compost metagenome]
MLQHSMLDDGRGTEAAQIHSKLEPFAQVAVDGEDSYLAQIFIVHTDRFQIRNVGEILGVIFRTGNQRMQYCPPAELGSVQIRVIGGLQPERSAVLRHNRCNDIN